MSQILSKLAYGTITWFWPVFFLVAVALVVWSIRSQPSWSSRQRFIPRDWGVVTTLLVAVPLLFFVLTGAAFAYHDNNVLLGFSVVGRNMPVAIWPDQGRYFPLFSQEFNVLSQISTTPAFFYAFIALELIAMCVLLNVLLAELSVGWRTLATAVVVSAGGTAIVFVEAIYPERNIVFLLVVFMVALKRFDAHPSRLNMAAALLSAHFAMYYKEPVFLLVATVALIRLLCVVRRDGTSWRSAVSWRSLARRPLELGLLAVSLVFAGQLAALVAGSVDNRYVENATVGPAEAAARYLRMEPLLVAFLAAIVVRVFRWRRTRQIDPLWDAVAVGAVVYFLTLVATGLAADRYMGPVELIGAIFAVREAATLWAMRPATRRLAAGGAILATAVVVTAATVFTGAFRVVEHASVVSGTEELADFVSTYASAHDGPVRLYFPSAEEFRIMNFAAYLKYRHANTTENVVLSGPREFPDGRCVYFEPYLCQASPQPGPGDLVVHLPDDAVRDETTSAKRTVLFKYSWLPKDVPGLVGRMYYVEAPLYTGSPMPKDWLVTTVELQPR